MHASVAAQAMFAQVLEQRLTMGEGKGRRQQGPYLKAGARCTGHGRHQARMFAFPAPIVLRIPEYLAGDPLLFGLAGARGLRELRVGFLHEPLKTQSWRSCGQIQPQQACEGVGKGRLCSRTSHLVCIPPDYSYGHARATTHRRTWHSGP